MDYDLRDTFDALNNGTSEVLTNGDKKLLYLSERQQVGLLNDLTIREATETVVRLAKERARLKLVQAALERTQAHLVRLVGKGADL